MWLLRGLRNGVLTTRYPRRTDDYQRDFPASVTVIEHRPAPDAEEVAQDCPTGAISAAPDGQLFLDRGRCILCGRCVARRPDLFGWQADAATATVSRAAQVVPASLETDDELGALRGRLAARTRALRRSVSVRHVDAGSDGAEEWEVAALFNPVYDVNRLGVFLTASPRHADLLLVTGAGARGMTKPLARTLEAMPRPLVVIAAGTDAVSGGLVAPSYAVQRGIEDLVPVDVWAPGSPPSPFTLLHAILLAVGRLPTAAEARR